MGDRVTTRTLQLTIEICCDSCYSARAQVTAPTLAAAKADLRRAGWAFRRWTLGERSECRSCARHTDRLIRDGILSRDGLILDQARWDAQWEKAHR